MHDLLRRGGAAPEQGRRQRGRADKSRHCCNSAEIFPLPRAAFLLHSPGPNARIIVSSTLAGGCVAHDTTRQSPVADRLASATQGKVQEIARASGPSAKISFAKPTPA